MTHEIARILLGGLYAAALQLVVGGMIYRVGACLLRPARGRGRTWRRWAGTWARAARALARAAPWAAALVLGAWLLVGLPPVWIRPVPFVVFGGLPTGSCYLLLHAGSLERRGRLGPSRRIARLGGQLMFVGVLALLVLVFSDLLFRPVFRVAVVRDIRAAGVALVTGMVTCGTAAFIGTLAGLSRKPRPSGTFAALFYVTGLLGLVAAAELALGR